MRKAVFPGSFDPITLGHVDIIRRCIPLFDEIVIGIGVNADKKYMFPIEERKRFIEETFIGDDSVSVEIYEGLTVEFCRRIDAQYIIRGLRNAVDFEYEKTIAHANDKLAGIETVNIFTSPETSFISSTVVRDVIRNNGDYHKLVPETVKITK